MGENFLASNYVLQFVPGELTVKVRDITITKTVDVTKAFVGDKLTYTITVTNTGDVDLQDVAVVDEMLGIEQVIGELKAGESWTQQFTYTAQESDAGKTLVNTAVTGTKDEKTLDQVDSDGTEITQKPRPHRRPEHGRPVDGDAPDLCGRRGDHPRPQIQAQQVSNLDS